ncbi:alpha/beta hydrolase [Alteromonas pelagimontana]|uniref:Alpha/beta hydrolase n=1 Tax=Alteromonas pelagimontana TaxID=1858656 RepID=A0A6M4MHU5_9ALTE|nr:alpha/beta hydrolase [Alteromonas pelagimontana]QJR82200.1 alpha/beta hydrolase [Alteromonas pelagimontana]
MIETEFHAGPLTLGGLDNQGEGQVIIGLHGFLDNAASLEPLFPYLTQYRFISLDLAGHGTSTHRPHGSHYNLVDYLQDLYSLLDHYEFNNVILLGHSLGGILATMYAATFPEQVKGVISIDACGPLTKPTDTIAEQIRTSILSRFKKSRNRLNIVNLEEAVQARCNVSDIKPEHAKAIISRNLTQDAGGHCFWASDPKLRTVSTVRLTEEQAEALMRNVQCPVWFGAASDSFKEVKNSYEARQHWFKNSQCEYFVGGHHIHMEKPELVGTAIRNFVEQL